MTMEVFKPKKLADHDQVSGINLTHITSSVKQEMGPDFHRPRNET